MADRRTAGKKAAERKAQRKPTVLSRAVKIALASLAAALMMAAFYLAVVLGQPQPNESAIQVDMTQPLLNASPAVSAGTEAEADELVRRFPVPVLMAMSGSGLHFVSGVSSDLAYEGGFARRAVLVYQTPAGQQMTVESIYPARALELMGKSDYHMAGVAGQPLAGMQSVRMENGTTIRLHAQSESGLYVVTLPRMDGSELSALIRSLQLTGD